MDGILNRMKNRAEAVPRPLIAFLSLAIIILIAVLDYLTGPEISVALLYVIPVSLCTWYLGRNAGLTAAVASELAWFIADNVISKVYGYRVLIYWNAVMRLGVFVTYALVLSAFKTMLERLEDERRRTHMLAARIIMAQEEERQRISRELHDEASQVLTGLTLHIEQMKMQAQQQSGMTPVRVEDLEHLRSLASHSLAEIRRLSFNLRPAMLEDLGLGRSLATLFRDQLRKKGIRVSFACDDSDLRLPPEVELTLYRISQEAVANIVKYAGASEVTARLSHGRGKLELNIRDNGSGFDQETVNLSRYDHLGISGMEERVALLSGKFHLISSPGNGTEIAISIPMEPVKAP